MKTEESVLVRLRELCLSLPETTEVNSWDHPNFRAGKKIFVAYEWFKGLPGIAFRIDPMEIDMLLLQEHFFTSPFGRGQWICLSVNDELDWEQVEEMVYRSYRIVAIKRMLTALDKMLGNS